jgi:hypothetical protein
MGQSEFGESLEFAFRHRFLASGITPEFFQCGASRWAE